MARDGFEAHLEPEQLPRAPVKEPIPQRPAAPRIGDLLHKEQPTPTDPTHRGGRNAIAERSGEGSGDVGVTVPDPDPQPTLPQSRQPQ